MISSNRNNNLSINRSFHESGMRYRSVRYKVSQSQSVVGKQAHKTFYTKSTFNTMKPRRSLGTSLTKIRGFPDEQAGNTLDHQRFQSANCIQVFKEMINSEKSVKEWKPLNKKPRVYLPVLNDQNPSKFLALDPLAWPINFIEKQIEVSKCQIQKQKEALKRTRQQIPIFQANQLRKLQDIKKQGEQSIKRLWNLLTANKVIQQEAVLKAKKAIIQTKQFIVGYKQQFEAAHKRTVGLQETIFSSYPFQLKQAEQFQAVSQKYF